MKKSKIILSLLGYAAIALLVFYIVFTFKGVMI